ncbi:hypothetical protein EMN47_04695 [Prolixibacteraceae bacterium JC049]|nr:hypothetical protein [Prolixibacteraceae bacterium JC049]
MKTYFRKLSIALFFGVFSILAVNAYAKELKRLANTATIASFEIEEMEPAMEIQAWMLTDLFWSPSSVMMTALVDEPEPQIQIEDWMSNDSLWGTLASVDSEDEEESMEIEEWMTDNTLWPFSF